MRGAVGGRRHAVGTAEARREGADAAQPDGEADVGDEWSVLRSSSAARSSRRVSRYWCGVSPNARRNSRLKCAGRDARHGRARARRAGLGSARRRVLRAQQMSHRVNDAIVSRVSRSADRRVGSERKKCWGRFTPPPPTEGSKPDACISPSELATHGTRAATVRALLLRMKKVIGTPHDRRLRRLAVVVVGMLGAAGAMTLGTGAAPAADPTLATTLKQGGLGARHPARGHGSVEARPESRRSRGLPHPAQPLSRGPSRREARDRAGRASPGGARSGRCSRVRSAVPRETAKLAFGRATVSGALLNTIVAEHDAKWRRQIQRRAAVCSGRSRPPGARHRSRHARQRCHGTRRDRRSRRARRSSSARSATAGSGSSAASFRASGARSGRLDVQRAQCRADWNGRLSLRARIGSSSRSATHKQVA